MVHLGKTTVLHWSQKREALTSEQARCISVTRAALWLKEWGSQEETWELLFKTESIAVSLVGKYDWKYKWSPKKVALAWYGIHAYLS